MPGAGPLAVLRSLRVLRVLRLLTVIPSLRRVVAALIERGVVVSESTRAPLRLAFPAKLASRWMPGLFPEQR